MEDWVYNQYQLLSNLNEMQWLNNSQKKAECLLLYYLKIHGMRTCIFACMNVQLVIVWIVTVSEGKFWKTLEIKQKGKLFFTVYSF